MRGLLALALLGLPMLQDAPPPAPAPPEIDFAELLVAHPAEAAGDVDAAVADWIAAVRERPEDPLAGAAVALAADRMEELEDPAAALAGLEAIDAARLGPGARREWARAVGTWRGRLETPERIAADPERDHFPDWSSEWRVLAPLPPRDDPFDVEGPSKLFALPGFHEVREGIDGPVRWRAHHRSGRRPWIEPDRAAVPAVGTCMLALSFDVPDGGPGWIEIDARDSFADLWLLAWSAVGGTWHHRTVAPSYSLSLNGEGTVVVDRVSSETSPIHHEPVVLRKGRNVLLVRANLGGSLRFAVRVLTEDGRVWPGLVESWERAEPGEWFDAKPPSEPLPSAVARLRRLDEPRAVDLALLGMLYVRERRESLGLAALERATELAPENAAVLARRAIGLVNAHSLPDVWARPRARELAERALEIEPARVDVSLLLADALASEDREEEAIELLREAERVHRTQPFASLALARVLDSLGMEAQAERALEEARERSPRRARVLDALADHHASVRRPTEALEARTAAARSGGASAARVEALALLHRELGDDDAAERLLREALARGPGPERRLDLARFLARAGGRERTRAADEILRRLAEAHPRWAVPARERADLARVEGRTGEELEHLREVLRRAPSDRASRARLRELGAEDPTEELFERFRIDWTEALARYDAAAWDDSIVRVVDAAVWRVHPDGSVETFTQSLSHARDLQACEEIGTQSPTGEVVAVATLKPDGRGGWRTLEPARIDGEYVMPGLEPGDFVLLEERDEIPPPRDGIVSVGGWRFASLSESFVRSRLVVSLPRDSQVRVLARNFDGTREFLEEGDSVVHVFDVRGADRILPEPLMPPEEELLPLVEVGMDEREVAIERALAAGARLALRRSPIVDRTAREVCEGVRGDEARARALFAFVSDHLDERQPGRMSSATAALLERQGDPAVLYAALLEAAGVSAELVWTRGISPAADPEPVPRFRRESWWRNRLIVRVRPADAPDAWCDLSSRTMPYGVLDGAFSGAPAIAVPSGTRLATPELQRSARPGYVVDLSLRLREDASAAVEGHARFLGGVGHEIKERIREVPTTHRELALSQLASQFVPGIDLESFELPGLDEEGVPVEIRAWGEVPGLLDERGDELSCKLPLLPLELGSGLGAGERRRRLPWFFPGRISFESTVRIALPIGIELASAPPSFEIELGSGHYRFEVERDDPRELVLHRDFLLEPLRVSAVDFPELAADLSRIDELERSLLRFRRAEPPEVGSKGGEVEDAR